MAEEKKGSQSATEMLRAMAPLGKFNTKDMPAVLSILPLRGAVFFPGGVLPLAIGRDKTIALIKDAVRDDEAIGVVTQRRAEEEDPGSNDLYAMGTLARIVKLLKMGEDNYSLVVQGLARFRVLELVQDSPYLKARVEPVEEQTFPETVEIEALAINLKKIAREVIGLMPELPTAAAEMVEAIKHPGHLADLLAANVDLPIEQKQAVLEAVELKTRMMLVLETMNRKREILTVAGEISAKVKASELSGTRRDDYLREQLRAIQEMLGEKAYPTTKACGFCGKGEREVKKLFRGVAAAVCDECIIRLRDSL